ncbi:MAG: hypothetical protein L0Z70_03555 [Chloroflexi bacterium]|nr:hypothetical protein [Chloroflexota bacterium]
MQTYWPYIVRLAVTLMVAVVLVAAFNEATYLLQKEPYDRAPQTVRLVIPAGAAERTEAGEAVSEIPEKMVFMVGDELEIVNEDNVAHQLGPVWAPPGATAKMTLADANRYSYSCSFTTTKYMGLDVRMPTTLNTRLTALAIGAPSVTVFLFIYGLLVFPIRPRPARGTGGAA